MDAVGCHVQGEKGRHIQNSDEKNLLVYDVRGLDDFCPIFFGKYIGKRTTSEPEARTRVNAQCDFVLFVFA